MSASHRRGTATRSWPRFWARHPAGLGGRRSRVDPFRESLGSVRARLRPCLGAAGQECHETVHYKRPDGTAFPVQECPELLPRATGQTVHGEDWLVRRDGSLFPVEYRSAPIGMPAAAASCWRLRTSANGTGPCTRSRAGRHLVGPGSAGLGDHARGGDQLREPGGGRGSRLRRRVRADRPERALARSLQAPGRVAFPDRGLPADAGSAKPGNRLYLPEDWWIRKDGSMIPVTWTAVPIRAPEGYGVAVAFTDMTARLAAEHTARERDVAEARAAELAASEARQRAILEAALDGVLSIDQQARITYANTAAEQIFGYRADELIGRPLAEAIVPPSLRQAHRDGFARYLATGEARILDQRIEITAMRADGSEFPAELTITRTGPPEAPAFTGYVRDITERQRAEQELMVSRARSGDGVRRRAPAGHPGPARRRSAAVREHHHRPPARPARNGHLIRSAPGSCSTSPSSDATHGLERPARDRRGDPSGDLDPARPDRCPRAP